LTNIVALKKVFFLNWASPDRKPVLHLLPATEEAEPCSQKARGGANVLYRLRLWFNYETCRQRW